MTLYTSKPKHFKQNDSCHNCKHQEYLIDSYINHNYWCGLHSFVISDIEIDTFKCEDFEIYIDGE